MTLKCRLCYLVYDCGCGDFTNKGQYAKSRKKTFVAFIRDLLLFRILNVSHIFTCLTRYVFQLNSSTNNIFLNTVDFN
jgi:hypothetical protein